MKKVVVAFVSAAALATIGMAAASDSMAAPEQSQSNMNSAGVFVSGNVGYDKFDESKYPLFTQYKNTGFAWNTTLGYQYNRYVAAEVGYTSFANVTGSGSQNVSGITTNESGKINNIFGIDLLAKGILPVNSKFNVFAKAGAMYLDGKASGTVNARNASYNGGGTLKRWVPEFGVGAGYYVKRNVELSVQGLTTLAVKGSGTGINNVTMPATYIGLAGVSYKFNM